MNDLHDPAKSGNTSVAAPQVSGKYLVIGLLLMGIASTAMMFIYWEKHTKPFRALREAIGREFRHSRPIVEGGRAKGHGPWTLRISMSVDFPPLEDSPKAMETANRVLEMTSRFPHSSELEVVQLNLIQFIPQEVAKTKQLQWTIDELRESGWKAQ